MVSHGIQLLESLIVLIFVVGAPVSIVWGWLRLARDSSLSTLSSKVSFLGFLFANASVCDVVVSWIYTPYSGVAYYDRPFVEMIRVGSWLSLIGFVISLLGCWRPSKLRWFAPVATLGSFLYWLMTALTA